MSNDLEQYFGCATIADDARGCSRLAVLALVRLAASAADDPLARARLLYNQRQFEAAVQRRRAGAADAGARRRGGSRSPRAPISSGSARARRPTISTNARDRLRRLDPQRFAPRERAEYIVGLGETLFFDGAFGAAATVFDSVLRQPRLLTGDARERVLDWWASALDRDARPRPEIERQGVYQRDPRRAWTTSWRRIPAAARRPTGWPPRRRGRRAICRRRGMPRRPAGCARRWRATRARRCAPTSIAWCCARSSPTAPRPTAQPPETLRSEWERFKESWAK